MGLGEIGVAQSLDKNLCFPSLLKKKTKQNKTDMIMSGPVPKKNVPLLHPNNNNNKNLCRCRTVRNSIANEKKIVNKTVYKGPRTFKRKYIEARGRERQKTQSVVVKKKKTKKKKNVKPEGLGCQFFQRRSVNA